MTDTAMQLRRIQWKASRRGILELDEWFSRFLQCGFALLSPEERNTFVLLLDEADPQLYVWLLGVEEAPEVYRSLIERIRQCK